MPPRNSRRTPAKELATWLLLLSLTDICPLLLMFGAKYYLVFHKTPPTLFRVFGYTTVMLLATGIFIASLWELILSGRLYGFVNQVLVIFSSVLMLGFLANLSRFEIRTNDTNNYGWFIGECALTMILLLFAATVKAAALDRQ